MANFQTQISNLQKVLATVNLTKPDGTPETVTGLTAQVDSGDGSFSMVDGSGNPLPVEAIYLVSGNGTGDTVYTVNVLNATQPVIATITLTVVEGALSVSITFSAPEPKA